MITKMGPFFGGQICENGGRICKKGHGSHLSVIKENGHGIQPPHHTRGSSSIFGIGCLSSARNTQSQRSLLNPFPLRSKFLKFKEMSHYFPEEILVEILVNLPVKTLIRFTLVSKSWHTLITSCKFVCKHLSYVADGNKKNSSIMLLRHYNAEDKKEHYTLHTDSEDFVCKPSEINFPVKSRLNWGFFRIVGGCNGLICLCDDQFGTFPTKPIILFNPSIQKSLVLPLPTIHPRSRNYVLGFGCDIQKCDYKVLRIVYDNGGRRTLDCPVEAEVYSLSKRSWERVKPTGLHCSEPFGTWRPVLYNGAVHWTAYSKKGFGNLIVRFDFGDEEFREILLPDALAGVHAANIHVNVHGDGLSIIKYNGFTNSCSVWVMKEYGVVGSWRKLYNIELVEGMDEIIGFRKNGELLVTMLVNEPLPYNLKRGKVVSYDPKSRLIKDLGILGWVRSLYVHNYVESLVLLEDQNEAAV